jgi:hypothetical protein
MTGLPLGLSNVGLSDLHESPDNPRTISDERFAALKHALLKDPKMMEARPIIAVPDGEIVAGNMRHRALAELVEEGKREDATAPTYVGDLTPAEKREWMLRDNQEYGDWVPEDLAALVAAHRDDDGDLSMLGFGDNQVEALLKAHDEPDDDGNGSSGGGGGASAEVWGIVVECDDEDQQAALVEELSDRGLEVRALLPT